VTSSNQTRRPGIEDPAPDSLPTRHSLLNRIKDLGDNTSWTEFFDTYRELIYNFARKAGLTNSEAQEVVQETVIRVCRSIGSFKTGREHGSFKAWLLQQTRWRIADQFRKRDKFARGPAGAAFGPGGRTEETKTSTVHRIIDPVSLELDEVWHTEWEEHLLKTALGRVKGRVHSKQFQMFDLHAVQGLSVRETARTVGVSTAAVYMAARRLRRQVRREVSRLRRTEPAPGTGSL